MNLVADALIRELILRQLSQGVDQGVFERLVEPAIITQINLQRDASGQTASNFDTDFLMVYIFAVTLMMSVFMTNGYLMQTVIEEKETRMIEMLVSSMRPTQLLAGKILALGALGLLQVASWLGAVVLLGRLAATDQGGTLAALATLQLDPGRVVLLVVYFVFGYLFFAAAYGIVGAISSSLQEGPQFAVIVTLPAVIPLYFLSLFIASPDAPLPVILSLFPVTAPISMVMRLTLISVPAWQFVVSLGLLGLLDVLMIWLAGRLFRVQSLLAGHSPRWRDLPKLLRNG
jgi:ABC-2 type transport system permease protein